MTVPLVRDYMAGNLVTVSDDMEINAAMNVLLKNRISGAPVLDDEGALVGVLSKKDCLRAALEASYYRQWGGPVRDYMTRKVRTIDADADILEATRIFVDSAFRRLPVLESGQLVGQLSRADALQAMSDLWD